MKALRSIATVGLLVASAAGATRAQAPPPAPQSREAIFKAARDVMDKAGVATLVTLDAKGAPDSRIVEPFPVEPDWVVWMATTSASRKVTEIARDPRVAMTYFDPATPGYVTLVGRAAIVRDPAEKAKRWKDAWTVFYKDRNRGADYTLIRVTATRLEISSPARGMNNDPLTWAPVTVPLR
ncbi:MAG TPA: pyridoxamine 5'-phosphate oxidase family protein [Vicinamibacterales bacterium]|nr:pyridoxamine 5'-phosphate oxidase family protein [Vicinamibacterales bacterium]